MPLEPHELEQIAQIREGVARIDERTERMDEEYARKFVAVHKRIDEVRGDAKSAGTKGGATAGGIIAAILSGLAAFMGFK